MTEVSVIMGTYNDADLLPETLDSVLDQELKDFELIVVDDGSSEQRVAKILADYMRKDSRVHVIHKDNEGLTRALMDGCNLAKGNYIARIDAGDMMSARRLGAQIEVFEQNPDCVLVSCWTEFCGPEWEHLWINKGSPSSKAPISMLPESPEQGLLGDIPHHGSTMFRKSTYKRAGGYRSEFYYGQDWDLWYRLAEIGSYQVVQESLYRARCFPGSISMTKNRHQKEISGYSKKAFIARRSGNDELVWLKMASKIRPGTGVDDTLPVATTQEPGFYFIGEALRRQGDSRCRKYLSKAIIQSPGKPRAYLRWLQSLVLRKADWRSG